MQTAQKKAHSNLDANDAFDAMLSDPSPNVFYSESIKDVVEDILDLRSSEPQHLTCSIGAASVRVIGSVQEITASQRKMCIRVLMTSDDAWKIFNNIDTVDEVTVNNSDNLAQSHRVMKAKISRLGTQNLCILALKLLKF